MKYFQSNDTDKNIASLFVVLFSKEFHVKYFLSAFEAFSLGGMQIYIHILIIVLHR